MLQCLQWIVDKNTETDSEYEGMVNTDKIGLAGHSQGGGAVIKAGDSEDITATIPMNPYGPGWVDPGNQNGPMMLLGGCRDTTTPPDSYEAVWEAVQDNDHGGKNAVLVDGTHNDNSPSLDRCIPYLGYTRGNVKVISMKANRIKTDANSNEIAAVLNYVLKIEEENT